MAEDKLGTLEYEMLINEEKLTKQLADIDKLLKAQNDKWKEALSNIGGNANLTIDTSNLITANKAVEVSTSGIKGSIKQLREELGKNLKSYELLSSEEKRNSEEGRKKIALIQDQKNKLSELGQAYRAQITIEREQIREKARMASELDKINKLQSVTRTSPDEINRLKAINKELEYQKTLKQNTGNQDALNKQIVANQALITKKQEEIKLNEKLAAQSAAMKKQALIVDAQPRNSAQYYTENIKYLELIRKNSTNPQAISFLTKRIQEEIDKRKQLIETLKEENKQKEVNWKRQMFQANVDAQQNGSVEQLRAKNQLLRFEINQISATAPDATAKLKALNDQIAANRQQINALQPTQNLWAKLVSAIRTYATAYLSVQAVMGLGRAVFTQTKELDQLAFSMQTVIKSSTELAQTQKFLSDVAINYGGDLLTLSERYIKFRAAAMQSNISAGETQKIYDSVSKAAGTLGLKTDELSGVYLALEQMISKGKVTTEELRRQLGERLPGAFGIMANALGVTIPQLDKMLKKGEVMSKEALPKFAAALEKAYGIESLKKIDTLAAAQGRMSTQFTGLIKAVGASDAFKSVINGIADFIGFIKDNIAVIGFFAKAITAVSAALLLQKVRLALIVPLQTAYTAVQIAYVFVTGRAVTATNRLTAAQIQAVLALRATTTAATILKGALSAMGGVWGIVIGAVVGAISYFTMFRNSTKETSDALTELNKQYDESRNNINLYSKSLTEVEKGTNAYKESLQGLNNIAIKYNSTLLTESSSIADINAKRRELILLLDAEYKNKKKIIDYEEANTSLGAVINPIKEDFFTKALEAGKTFDETSLAFARFKDLASQFGSGKINFDVFVKSLNKLKDEFGLIPKQATEAGSALIKFDNKIKELDAFYRTNEKPIQVFNLDDLKAAKLEFEELAKLQKVGGEATLERSFSTGYESYKQYLESLLKLDYLTADQRKQVYLELADFEKKTTGGGTGKDPRLESLKNQLSLLEKMKAEYDKLTKVVTPDLALSKVLDAFAPEMEKLKFTITPQLDTEGFVKVLNDFANAVAKYDSEFAASIREKIPVEFTEDIAEKFKRMFQEINDEIDRFTAKDELRKSIFDITGDMELSIKLTTDKTEVVDIVQYMKDEVQKVAKAAGFDNSFEELTAMINDPKMTSDLKKAIEDVQKYVADKSKNILLDALKFIYEGIPEGVDIQFDFSKVLIQLNKSLDEIQKGAQSAIASGVIPEDTINRVKQLGIDSVNEVAKNAVDKLGANYIKDNLPEQLANDFEHMADASQESIKAIVAAIEEMKTTLKSEDSINSFFKVSGLDNNDMQPIIDSLVNTESFDEFLAKVQDIKKEIANVSKDSENALIGDTFISKEDLALLDLLILALEKLGFTLKGAGTESVNRSFEEIAQDAQKLGNEINNLISNVEELADSFGIGFSQSAKNALEGIKNTATGVMSVIENAAKLAKEGISAMEKASVIIAIISAVVQMASGVAKIIRANKEAEAERAKQQEQQMKELIAFQLEYNLALNDTLRLRTKESIFFTDNVAKIRDASIAYKDAEKALNDFMRSRLSSTLLGYSDFNLFGGNIKNTLNTFFINTSSGYKTLLQAYPELIDANNELNISLAETVATSSGLDETTKIAFDTLIDWQKKMIEAQKQMDEAISTMIGGLGNDIYKSLSDAWDNSTDSFMAFKTTVSQGLEDLTKQMIFNTIWGQSLELLKKNIADSYSLNGDQSVFDDFQKFFAIAPDNIRKTNEAWAAAERTAAAAGLDWRNNASDVQGSISRAIQGVTEDTARRLEGLINSIRETTVKNMGNTKEMLASTQMIQAYSGQSLAKLTNIDNNIAMQLALFNGIMTNASGVGGQGLKVYIQ